MMRGGEPNANKSSSCTFKSTLIWGRQLPSHPCHIFVNVGINENVETLLYDKSLDITNAADLSALVTRQLGLREPKSTRFGMDVLHQSLSLYRFPHSLPADLVRDFPRRKFQHLQMEVDPSFGLR
ncbi:hypothetical protein NL676_013838 [Syzygium grande]|nr:hypothetical protein NL676_013838 [Syzygium grande]